MRWVVRFHPEFDREHELLAVDVQDELLAHMELLEALGPQLGRPNADTLNGSRYANMKELRFYAGNGAWRVAFAFDPDRHGYLACRRRQVRGERKTILQAANSHGGRPLPQTSGTVE